MKNWLVVANAARARILEETDRPGAYLHRADLVHTQSRLKGSEIGADRAGHVKGSAAGPGGAAYMPRTDVRDHEHDRFARELADTLSEGVSRGECAGLTLVASNPFLGLLKSHLSPRATAAILRTVPSDYTSLPDEEIAGHLRQSGP